MDDSQNLNNANSLSASMWNVPNQLTIARIVLACVCFVFLSFEQYGVALVLFAIAAGTDWLDGYWARRFNQITQLGRILDPFADKFIICGVFVFLAAVPESKIAPWVAVLVMARELMVTVIRSFLEARGVDFSAKWSGKWKMVAQCAAALLSMYRLTFLDKAALDQVAPDQALEPAWLSPSLTVAVWLTIFLTIYSCGEYVLSAARLLKADKTLTTEKASQKR